jgi:hypothetical protein
MKSGKPATADFDITRREGIEEASRPFHVREGVSVEVTEPAGVKENEAAECHTENQHPAGGVNRSLGVIFPAAC